MGSPHLNVEFSRLPDSYMAPFDACGTLLPDGKIGLVEHGKVVGPYLDKVTACASGLQETAATWAAYDGVPGFGYMPLKLTDDRKLTLQELLLESGSKQAVLAFTSGGGEYSQEGSFTAPVQLAYLMENGLITGKLPPVTVSGKVDRMFGPDYLGVSQDSLLAGMDRRCVVMRLQVDRL